MENKNQSSKEDANIAGKQEHEVNYQKEKMSGSGEEDKKVVKQEAHPRQKPERKFRNRPLL